MYRVDRNNFHENQKNSTIYTPEGISNFIFKEMHSFLDSTETILDPCCGNGSLLNPFKNKGYQTLGVDIEDQGYKGTVIRNFLEMERGEFPEDIAGVIMNPPFNIDDKTKDYIKKKYGGRPLLPEVWLMKTIELFGKGIPMVLFTPYGFRLNQTFKSKRWQKLTNGTYPQISSIVSLPKDCFEDVLFHAEILIFNIEGLKPHYFAELIDSPEEEYNKKIW